MADRKSDFALPTLDDLFSTQEERDEARLEKIRDIPLDLIDDFPDHPFHVRDDEDMVQLVESIKTNCVRKRTDGMRLSADTAESGLVSLPGLPPSEVRLRT